MGALSLPAVFDRYPRVPLLWPFHSPLERLDRVSNTLRDTNVRIWMKRDDCNSGLGLGGSKVRALEYIFADILAKGCDVAVTEGPTQSNCARLVAAAAAKLGIESRLIQRPASALWNEPTTPNYLNLGNIQVAKIISPSYIEGTAVEVMADMVKAGRKPYNIPRGASGVPVSGLGYARLAFEIMQQEREQGVFFDTVILSAASGGTTGGLTAGFRFATKELGLSHASTRRIISVFVGSDLDRIEKAVMNMLQTTTNLLNPDQAVEEQQLNGVGANLEIDLKHTAGGHGNADDKTTEAMRLVGSLEGIVLEPAYTGKSFACLMDKIAAGEIESGSNVLFLHTGGVIVLGAYSHLDFTKSSPASSQWIHEVPSSDGSISEKSEFSAHKTQIRHC